jgi:acyl-CoA thioesterase FadM
MPLTETLAVSEPFTQNIRTRLHEMDAWQQLKTSSLLSYMEQAATDMSVESGFDPDWYATQGTAWVMRSITLQRLGTAKYGDDLVTTAWVSSSQRIRLWSDYEVRHVDGSPVAVGRAEWVYLDRVRRLPRPIDPAILKNWPTRVPSDLWKASMQLPLPEPGSNIQPYGALHPVFSYDADVMGHTNNAVYANWLEDEARSALRSWGYAIDLPQPSAPKLRLDLLSTTIQYLGPTHPGDSVTITTTLIGADSNYASVAQQVIGPEAASLVSSETVYRLYKPADMLES